MSEVFELLLERARWLWRRLGLSRLSRRARWALFGGCTLVLGVLLALAASYDEIMRVTLDPKAPFQTYAPPPAPDYALTSAWALIPPTPDHPTAADPPTDVFFIHPTTFDGGRDWNGPIDDAKSQRQLERVMLPNYAGPFARVGRLFAPRYRQASLYTSMTLREDARAARVFAYGDVLAAFRFYLAHFNGGRPIVLVGVEQGGLLGERLLREEIAKTPAVAQKLVAAYLIDTVVPKAPYDAPSAPVPACKSPTQDHCLVAWVAVPESDPNRARQILSRALVWQPDGELDNLKEQGALCVNPLLGAETDAAAPAKLNLGAANASELEWGARPAFLPRQVSAQCMGGVLRVSHPRSASLRPAGNWPDKFKARSNNLFFADIEADAMRRGAAFLGLPSFPLTASAIDRSVVVRTITTHRID